MAYRKKTKSQRRAHRIAGFRSGVHTHNRRQGQLSQNALNRLGQAAIQQIARSRGLGADIGRHVYRFYATDH